MQSNDSVSHQHKSDFPIYEGDFGRGKIFYQFTLHIKHVIVDIDTTK